jgi:type IV pilus secretin PilQ/predicted competence protein
MRPPLLVPLVVLGLAGFVCAGEPPLDRPVDAAAVLTDPARRVSIDVKDVPLDQALQMLAKPHDLSIISAQSVKTNVTARFSDVTLEQALESLVTINGFAYRTKGRVIEIYSPPAGEAVTVEKPVVRTFHLNYASADKLKVLLKPFLTKEHGKIEAEASGNALIVHDVPGAVESVARVLTEIDRPEPQVTIGAEIIEAGMDMAEKLGIDWEARVAVTGATRPTTFPFNKNNSHNRFIPSNSPGAAADDDDDDAEFSPDDSFPYATREDFTFGTIDASGLRIILNMLKSDGGTNLIANPEITTLNSHEAKINIGDTVPVPIFTTNLETGVTATTGFEDVETGVILSVTPLVNENRTITMDVRPEISEIIGFKGQFDERPIVASRKAATRVRVRDGETLVIGGLVRNKSEEEIKKIPFFGDIPLFGWFFKNKAVTQTKSSLYIFITPRIMKEELVRTRAHAAGSRLLKEGLRDTETGADDLRNPGASPFLSPTPIDLPEAED